MTGPSPTFVILSPGLIGTKNLLVFVALCELQMLRFAQHDIRFSRLGSACPPEGGRYSERLFFTMSATICCPWNRPFSMKISFVAMPAMMTPAR